MNLEEFEKELMQCPPLIKDLRKSGSANGEECEFKFSNLIDQIDCIIHDDSAVEEEIEAQGAYEEVFNVTIKSYSEIVYWIQANEFDDIKYFSTKEDALNYAHDEFSSYIGALEC
ncbi:hypothetical protein OAK16_04660 [Verrucomicrobia bacterium]|nr:hypothetical protein [Verrucomicrobiota bacterium]